MLAAVLDPVSDGASGGGPELAWACDVTAEVAFRLRLGERNGARDVAYRARHGQHDTLYVTSAQLRGS